MIIPSSFRNSIFKWNANLSENKIKTIWLYKFNENCLHICFKFDLSESFDIILVYLYVIKIISGLEFKNKSYWTFGINLSNIRLTVMDLEYTTFILIYTVYLRYFIQFFKAFREQWTVLSTVFLKCISINVLWCFIF